MARAAGSTSRSVASVIVVLAGSTSTATRAAGHFAQEPQPLRHQLSRENIDPRQVAAGPGEAGAKTEPSGVFSGDEHDRNRRGSRLQRRKLSYGHDNRDPAASQIVG